MGAFKGLLDIIETIPSEVLDVAQAAVTDVVKVVNDIENGDTGAIISGIEQIPGKVVSEVTSDWGEITAGLEQDFDAFTNFFGCLLKDCSPSTYNCGPAATSAGTTTTNSLPTTLVTPTRSALVPSTRTPSSPTLSTSTQNTFAHGKSSTMISVDHALNIASDSLTSRSSNSVPTTTIATSPENLGTRVGSNSFESKLVQMCALGLLTVSFVAFLL